MGLAKRTKMENDEYDNFALALLCEVGALIECKNHSGTYFEGSEDVNEAYKLANARISSGAIKLPSRLSRRDFTDMIKSRYDEYSAAEGCPECTEHFGGS